MKGKEKEEERKKVEETDEQRDSWWNGREGWRTEGGCS